MPSKKIEKAINDQIQNEFYASYLYLAMSAYCESINFPGFAHWMRQQNQEETEHAMKLFDYLHDRGGRVTLQEIKKPPANFRSALDMFQQALKHEQAVTKSIHALYGLAQRENDYPTAVELQWFVTEQVEEEKAAGDIVERLKMIGKDTTALYLMDRDLGSRTAG
ncbi:MAG: ferritin [Acidobacteriota bacterium]